MDSLAAARAMIERHRRGTLIGLAFFALSPVPSAQLFEAAGLMNVRLLRFTLAFFLGRVVTYAIYGTTARKLQYASVGQAFERALTSPWGIAIQLAAIALLVLLGPSTGRRGSTARRAERMRPQRISRAHPGFRWQRRPRIRYPPCTFLF